MSALLLLLGIAIGWFVGSAGKDETKRAVKKLEETILALDKEEKEIQKQIKQGEFKGRKLVEREEVRHLYRIKIHAYWWCLSLLSQVSKETGKVWRSRKKDYSYNYSKVFKKLKYCKKCHSLHARRI